MSMLKFYRDFNSRIAGVYQRDNRLALYIMLNADGLKHFSMSSATFARTFTHPMPIDPCKAVRVWFCRALTKSRNDVRAFQLVKELYMNKELNEMTMEELVAKHNEVATELGKPTVDTFKSLKAARLAVEKLTKPVAAPKPKKPAADLEVLGRGPIQGVGKFAKDLLLTGMTNNDVLAKVLEQYPSAKTSKSCIAYYRTKLIGEGLLISSKAAAVATPSPAA